MQSVVTELRPNITCPILIAASETVAMIITLKNTPR